MKKPRCKCGHQHIIHAPKGRGKNDTPCLQQIGSTIYNLCPCPSYRPAKKTAQ